MIEVIIPDKYKPGKQSTSREIVVAMFLIFQHCQSPWRGGVFLTVEIKECGVNKIV